MISLIVAVDKNGLIGNHNQMPWHIKDELQHFKEYTWNKKILIGRKTLESLKKPLKNRYHYVLSSKPFNFQNVEVINDINIVINKYKNIDEELVVIGGAKVYESVLDVVDKMVISVIQKEYMGDTYFPKFDVNKFEVISKEMHDEFIVYTMIRKEI